MTSSRYVIVTAARNEAAFIGDTIQSVLAQTVQPLRWIIVSNGSTDETESIVRAYSATAPFINLISLPIDSLRNFAVKAQAIQTAFEQIKDAEFEFIANLDADILLPPDYYEGILSRFTQDPGMGIAAGIYLDIADGGLSARITDLSYPSGAIQVFRRPCFEAIGGYPPLQWGGEDTAVSVMARMLGWKAKAYPNIQVLHQRAWGTAGGSVLAGRYRQGKMDYHLGMHPLFAFMKAISRLPEKPTVLGCAFRFAGYIVSWLRGEKLHVSPEFVEFIRMEQGRKISSLFKHELREGGNAKHEERFS